MRECIFRVENYTSEGRNAFSRSNLIQDAVIRNLQTLAESSQRLSEAAKESEPDLPWRGISGFRNILVHGYLGLDLSVIWAVVESELPPLRLAVERMIRVVEQQRGAP